MGRRMTLKGQISLCLAAFFLALAGQIFLSFYQSGTVLRELDDQMGNFNAISRFQNGVEQSLSAMENYRWEYGDAKALTEELNRAFSVTNAWLWRIQGDIGTVSEEQYLLYNAVSTTYGSYTALVGQLEEAVASGECDKGIVICTTGIGISITANKVKGIRCALCGDPLSAEMTRRHNDANMLAMGAGIIGPNLAKKITEVFLTTEFEGGRHARRVGLLDNIQP